jgi:putative flippase GtrA
MAEAHGLVALFRQFLRFGMVGGVITVLSIIVYWVPATFWGVPPLLSNFLAYVFAVALGYSLHSRVSFAGHGDRDQPLVRTGRFFVVSLVSLALNSLWVWLLTGVLDGPTWWPIIPMVFVSPLATFALNRQWVFG